MSLYKFIHILLLKNDVQLKQKSDKQPKKIQWPKFIFKKSCLKKITSKQKKKEEEEEATSSGKQKEKRKKRKRRMRTKGKHLKKKKEKRKKKERV